MCKYTERYKIAYFNVNFSYFFASHLEGSSRFNSLLCLQHPKQQSSKGRKEAQMKAMPANTPLCRKSEGTLAAGGMCLISCAGQQTH